MSKGEAIRLGGPAAMLGGFVYILAFVAVYLIYVVFAERAEENFFGQHAFIHMIDTPMFALLALGAIGVYLSQSERLGRVAKAGFWLTLAGFGLSVVGGLAIIVVGLAVSDEDTAGVLDVITHPLAQLLYTLGSLIFGVALLRKGTLPKFAALLATVGPVALLALFAVGLNQAYAPITAAVTATGLGWAWLGYALLCEQKRSVVPSRNPAVQ